MFKKAERKQTKLKLAVTGATGSGKTFSALRLATGLGGKIAFIDTENGSASLYSDKFDFDVLDLAPPFTTEKYIEAINFAEKSGYATIVIDSLTHAWAGEGGLLEQKALLDSRPNSNHWTNWAPIDKKDSALKNAFLHSSCHIIATMRSKMEYAQTENNGKKKIEKLGLAPIQRDGLAYEFSIVFDIAMDHNAEVSKDRTHLFSSTPIFKVTEETGKMLADWLSSGKVIEPEPVTAHTEPKPLIEPKAPWEKKKAEIEQNNLGANLDAAFKKQVLLDNPSEFVITFGTKFKDKKLSEVGLDDIDKSIIYWKDKQKTGTIPHTIEAFMINANEYLISKNFYPPEKG